MNNTNIDNIQFELLDESDDMSSRRSTTSFWYVPEHGRFAVHSVRDRANDIEQTVIHRAVLTADGVHEIANFHNLWSENYYSHNKNAHISILREAVEHWEQGLGMTRNLWKALS